MHGSEAETYVAERNLEPDPSGAPVNHPLVGEMLGRFEDGRYRPRERAN